MKARSKLRGPYTVSMTDPAAQKPVENKGRQSAVDMAGSAMYGRIPAPPLAR